VLHDSPEWARSCAECRKYVIGPTGAVSTRRAKDAAGRVVELPMLRSEAGVGPPCGTCPKTEGRAKEPLPEDDDFAAWFWDVRDWFHECRAVGQFGDPDPLMRAVAAELDRAERQAQSRSLDTLSHLLRGRR
jgi:hypothetical protein